MNPRQIVILVAALLFLVGSVLPKPIVAKATGKPFENQWLAQVCLAAVGVAMILALRTVP
jgi:protein-S-isoprenylcysteine O-methyltransferase Ste14